MNKRDSGYGVCGAKNSYNSRVKLDNWVEDSAGELLARQINHPERMNLTEQRSSFSRLEERDPIPSGGIKFLTTEELVAKNKEGNPYALLFNHGKELTISHRFSTTSQSTFVVPANNDEYARKPNSLRDQKLHAMKKDFDLANYKTTEQRSATAFMKGELQTNIPSSSLSIVLPDFRRVKYDENKCTEEF